MAYLEHLVLMACFYFLLTSSLNLVVGYAGLISLHHSVLFGFGAYTYSLLAIRTGAPPVVVLWLITWLGGVIAIALGYICLRGRQEVFTFITLALQVIFFTLAYNASALTRGPYGISGVPRLVLSTSTDAYRRFILTLLLAVCIVVAIFLKRVMHSAFGLSIRALRDDERAAEGLGIPFYGQMIRLFGLTGLIAAFTGGVYASYIGYISPHAFGLDESFLILVALLLGGSDEKKTRIGGVLAVVGLPEVLSWMNLPSSIAANLRVLLFQAIIILIIFFRFSGRHSLATNEKR